MVLTTEHSAWQGHGNEIAAEMLLQQLPDPQFRTGFLEGSGSQEDPRAAIGMQEHFLILHGHGLDLIRRTYLSLT